MPVRKGLKGQRANPIFHVQPPICPSGVRAVFPRPHTWRRWARSIAAISVSSISIARLVAPAFSFSSPPWSMGPSKCLEDRMTPAFSGAAFPLQDETTRGSPARSARDFTTTPARSLSSSCSGSPPSAAREDIARAERAAAVARADANAAARLSSSASSSAAFRIRAASTRAASNIAVAATSTSDLRAREHGD
eukprot:scaffold168638_cov27-Tisochrysis_lutea.AAC.3